MDGRRRWFSYYGVVVRLHCFFWSLYKLLMILHILHIILEYYTGTHHIHRPYIYLLFNNSCSAAVCVPVTHGTEQEPRDTTEKCPSPPTQPQLPPGVSLITEQLLCHCLLWVVNSPVFLSFFRTQNLCPTCRTPTLILSTSTFSCPSKVPLLQIGWNFSARIYITPGWTFPQLHGRITPVLVLLLPEGTFILTPVSAPSSLSTMLSNI